MRVYPFLLMGSRLGLLGLLGELAFLRAASSKGGKRSSVRVRTTTLHPINGKHECERRRRQIAVGSLRIENGLVLT